MTVTDLAGWMGLARASHEGREREKEFLKEQAAREKRAAALHRNLTAFEVPAFVEIAGYEEGSMLRQEARTFVEPDLVGKVLFYAKLRVAMAYKYSFRSPLLPPSQNLTHGGVVVAKGKGCGVLLGSAWSWRADQLDILNTIPGGLEKA